MIVPLKMLNTVGKRFAGHSSCWCVWLVIVHLIKMHLAFLVRKLS